jgi:hypothetical protein
VTPSRSAARLMLPARETSTKASIWFRSIGRQSIVASVLLMHRGLTIGHSDIGEDEMKQAQPSMGSMRIGGLPRLDGGARQRRLRWRRWQLVAQDEPDRLTSAELSECTCPDLCQRDHDHD